MNFISLTSPRPPFTTSTSVLSTRQYLVGNKSCISAQSVFHQNAKLSLFRRSQYSGSIKTSSIKTEAIQQDTNSEDSDLVFVAGATGKVGSRTVRELLKLGFRVIAGVRSAQKAEQLVQSVQQMKFDDEVAAVEKLKIVECDLERDYIKPVISNASVVICCIGASEKEVFDVTGPYRIDYQATKNLIDAATAAGVGHFILLTSLGTNKFGFPAAILNLFWGVLCWKRKAEETLLASGLPYTIVRPGGMERPTDTYKETHNMTLALEDTLFGGQVSNLQVAELIAFMAKNRNLSYCKVVEVIAETTAPLTPIGELLVKIPCQRVDSSVPKELQTVPTLDPVAAPSILSEASSNSTENEPSKSAIMTTLSPYAAYEDLKPPTSPTPSKPSSTKALEKVLQAILEPATTKISVPEQILAVTETKPTPVEVQKKMFLSPYASYEDLKPPTSPTPTPSTSKEKIIVVAPQVEILPPPTGEISEQELSEVLHPKPSHLSPYHAYADLKPPTTPCPNPPSRVLVLGPVAVGKSQITPEIDSSPSLPQNLQPLSPFTMYEDLKPPSSPSKF